MTPEPKHVRYLRRTRPIAWQARSISSGLPDGREEETWQSIVCDACGTALRQRLGDAIWMVAPQQPAH
jgi:hypothetical protein